MSFNNDFIEVNNHAFNKALNNVSHHRTNHVNDVSEYFNKNDRKFAVKGKDKKFIHKVFYEILLRENIINSDDRVVEIYLGD